MTVKHVKKNSLLSQRFIYDNFRNVKKLTLIFDVSTRWNSCYDMLLRFKKLNTFINWWIENVSNQFKDLRLKSQKWHQITYLIQLFRTFKIIIDFVSRFKIIIIHRIWDAYDNLFNHLKSQQTEAKKIDRHLWISELNRAIKAKHVKLVKYNDKIKHFYEKFLNFATILDLEVKLNLYAICDLLCWFFLQRFDFNF